MLNLYNYLTASNKYPARANHTEVTAEVIINAKDLLNRVSSLLNDLGEDSDNKDVSSGFRPSDVNAKLANAAKKSLHMTGVAIDIKDLDGSLGKKIASRPDLLRKYGLFIEDLKSTKGWVHLDMSKTRSDRPSRSFIP